MNVRLLLEKFILKLFLSHHAPPLFKNSWFIWNLLWCRVRHSVVPRLCVSVRPSLLIENPPLEQVDLQHLLEDWTALLSSVSEFSGCSVQGHEWGHMYAPALVWQWEDTFQESLLAFSKVTLGGCALQANWSMNFWMIFLSLPPIYHRSAGITDAKKCVCSCMFMCMCMYASVCIYCFQEPSTLFFEIGSLNGLELKARLSMSPVPGALSCLAFFF